MYNVFARIPVKYCSRCGRIYLNVKYCLWCGRKKETQPLPPRHQYIEIGQIPSLIRSYYEQDIPIDGRWN